MDLFVKFNLPSFPYRYISKPLVMLSLFCFYYLNSSESNKNKYLFMCFGIFCFLAGDILLIDHLNKVSFIIGISLFMVGKILYSLKFSNNHDFKTSKLIPFLFLCFVYMFVLFKFIFDGLKGLFIPILLYFFVTLVMAQMIFLRKGSVSQKSYILGLIGVVLLILGETIAAIKLFYKNIPYQDILNMLFYGLSQLLLVYSVVVEKKKSNLTTKVL